MESAGRLGMRPIQRDGRLVVGDLRSGGAAARAGLAAGDVLLSVDGHALEGLGIGAAHYHLFRPPGTRVSLTVLAATGQPRTVELVTEPR